MKKLINWFQSPKYKAMASHNLPASAEVLAQTEKYKENNCMVEGSVYELLPSELPDVEIVLFHGLQRNESDLQHAFWKTWNVRGKETSFWPVDLLPGLLKQPNKKAEYNARVLSVTYEACVVKHKAAQVDQTNIAERLIEDLILGDVELGQPKAVPKRQGTNDSSEEVIDVPVILVGHDLGGILIKHFVMAVEEKLANAVEDSEIFGLRCFLENLKGVFFYGTPLAGSRAIERAAARIPDKEKNPMLSLLKVLGRDTARLNEAFRKFRIGEKRFKTYAVTETAPTLQDGFEELIVSEGSARQDCDGFYSVRDCDHFEVCQPSNEKSASALCLERFTREIVKSMKDSIAEKRFEDIKRYRVPGAQQQKKPSNQEACSMEEA